MKLSTPKSQTKREFGELQKIMATAVMRPLTRGDKMQIKWIDGRPTKIVVKNFIKPNDRLTSFERLEIYNRQYWFRVRDCFYSDYPGLRAILGDKKFERLTDEYLTQNPSRSFTLRNLGSRLVKFLEANPKLIAPHSQLALDMARLEWAHIEAFDNEAVTPLQPDAILDSNPAKIQLQLQPHLTLLCLKNELDDFLIEVKKNSGLRNEASNAMEQNQRHKKISLSRRLKQREIFLAVHRHDDSVYYKRLERGQFLVLTALQRGVTLEKACAQLVKLKSPGDLGDIIKKWFSNWAALGWFCGIKQ
ncbi:MAG TPA: DNA-binding domain-containing protein [Verrucomicrobiae bacterium]|nr:DNA-binding domain-containing protein [Verrucomicrobiae bacterium]